MWKNRILHRNAGRVKMHFSGEAGVHEAKDVTCGPHMPVLKPPIWLPKEDLSPVQLFYTQGKVQLGVSKSAGVSKYGPLPNPARRPADHPPHFLFLTPQVWQINCIYEMFCSQSERSSAMPWLRHCLFSSPESVWRFGPSIFFYFQSQSRDTKCVMQSLFCAPE